MVGATYALKVLPDYEDYNNRTLAICQWFVTVNLAFQSEQLPALEGHLFTLLSMQVDRNKFAFVSEMEGQACPVFGPDGIRRIALFGDS